MRQTLRKLTGRVLGTCIRGGATEVGRGQSELRRSHGKGLSQPFRSLWGQSGLSEPSLAGRGARPLVPTPCDNYGDQLSRD